MWIAIVLAGVLLLFAVFLLAPRRGNPADGPLPTDVETMLLLGESPAEDIASDPTHLPRAPAPDPDPGPTLDAS